jgi:C4-dicarboxylate-specific signal transduction histidine kinase
MNGCGRTGKAIEARSIKVGSRSGPRLSMQATHAAPSTPQILSRYILAIVLVLTATYLSLVLQVRLGNPFWLLFPVAVIASTWYCGKGPGWVAVGLSTVAVLYYFIPPFRSFSVKPEDIPFFLSFIACALIANWLIAWRKEIEDSLKRARAELEARVEERTAELKSTNEALVNQIAEQKRTEAALQVTRTELARVVRITTIGGLTASIAHEVNQPLAAVVANADACVAWLSRQDPNLTEARAAAERTIQGATRASEVIVRIRSLISKATPERAQVGINDTIKQALALADGQAFRNNVSVVAELAPDLPAVLGDAVQLQQVTLNLLMNGIEAMIGVNDRPRQLVVRSELQEGGQIHVSVQDSGIGLSSEVMARLFEPFFTTRAKGIGMGLPTSRSIIETHGGKLWAEPNDSHGASFQFTLPSAGGPS